jgi:hypothetical protein
VIHCCSHTEGEADTEEEADTEGEADQESSTLESYAGGDTVL